MVRIGVRAGAALVLALVTGGAATAQVPAGAAKAAAAPAVVETVRINDLKGAWVRPDGGYVIEIRGSGPDGKLDATYFNPKPLPFAKAQAMQDGATVRAFFELQAGGYAGSTYALTYDPAGNRLKGTYYQAVARQRFEVYFVRK